MNTRRIDGHDDLDCDSGERRLPAIIETMRNAATRHQGEPAPAKSNEEKVSLFWRIFGGTLLSIVALLIITAYQSISSSIHELRDEMAHLNEAKADFVKKDEYSASRTRTWDKIQEVQKDSATAAMPITQVKDRLGQVEEEMKSQAAERKELLKEIQSLRERVARLEAVKEPHPVAAKPDGSR